MIAVVDVVGSNIRSLELSLRRLGVSYQLTHSPDQLSSASHVILAGVGSAYGAMTALTEHGLVETLRNLAQPVLGICSGMQILFSSSTEGPGTVMGLGVFSGQVDLISPVPRLSLPHSGWNQLVLLNDQAGPSGVGFDDLTGRYVYFVHSYCAPMSDDDVVFYVDYGVNIPALVRKNNYWGAQFHPEKSGRVGHEFLKRFCSL